MTNWAKKIKHRTYNPDVEGKGNTEAWKEAFEERMGKKKEKASKYFPDCTTKDELTKQYRKLIKQYHTDIAGNENSEDNTRISQEIIEEYNELKKKLK